MASTLFLAAGEVSGDVHGAALARALLELAPDVRLAGWGSHRMRGAGVAVLEDLVPYAAVGLTENVAALRPASRALKAARAFLAERRPAAVVLIDYQGANMVLARHARALGIPSVYYISPQEWIWGFRGGPAKVARQVDTILAVFGREAEVYRQAGANVRFVGHPLLDQVPPRDRALALRRELGLGPDDLVLGLFPGSRRTEIERLLPAMASAARLVRAAVPGLRALLPVASAHFRDLLRRCVSPDDAWLTVIEDRPGMEVLAACTAALAASGTVTLEAAVVGTPVVAAYRVSALTAFLARRVFKIGHVTLPNILSGRAVIPELLQEDANPRAMSASVLPLLVDAGARERTLAGLGLVRAALGEPGATLRAARAVLEAAGR